VISDEEAFKRWVAKLHTEWLPNWQDMPDITYAWWNLLITVLDDAQTDERGDIVDWAFTVEPLSNNAPRPAPPTPGAALDARKPEPGACRGSSRGRTGRRQPGAGATRSGVAPRS